MLRCYQDVSLLLDLARQRIIFETVADLALCLRLVCSDFDVVVARIKNRLDPSCNAQSTAGYRDVLVTLSLRCGDAALLGCDGHLCELQLALLDFARLQVLGLHRLHCAYFVSQFDGHGRCHNLCPLDLMCESLYFRVLTNAVQLKAMSLYVHSIHFQLKKGERQNESMRMIQQLLDAVGPGGQTPEGIDRYQRFRTYRFISPDQIAGCHKTQNLRIFSDRRVSDSCIGGGGVEQRLGSRSLGQGDDYTGAEKTFSGGDAVCSRSVDLTEPSTRRPVWTTVPTVYRMDLLPEKLALAASTVALAAAVGTAPRNSGGGIADDDGVGLGQRVLKVAASIASTSETTWSRVSSAVNVQWQRTPSWSLSPSSTAAEPNHRSRFLSAGTCSSPVLFSVTSTTGRLLPLHLSPHNGVGGEMCNETGEPPAVSPKQLSGVPTSPKTTIVSPFIAEGAVEGDDGCGVRNMVGSKGQNDVRGIHVSAESGDRFSQQCSGRSEVKDEECSGSSGAAETAAATAATTAWPIMDNDWMEKVRKSGVESASGCGLGK